MATGHLHQKKRKAVLPRNPDKTQTQKQETQNPIQRTIGIDHLSPRMVEAVANNPKGMIPPGKPWTRMNRMIIRQQRIPIPTRVLALTKTHRTTLRGMEANPRINRETPNKAHRNPRTTRRTTRAHKVTTLEGSKALKTRAMLTNPGKERQEAKSNPAETAKAPRMVIVQIRVVMAEKTQRVDLRQAIKQSANPEMLQPIQHRQAMMLRHSTGSTNSEKSKKPASHKASRTIKGKIASPLASQPKTKVGKKESLRKTQTINRQMNQMQ